LVDLRYTTEEVAIYRVLVACKAVLEDFLEMVTKKHRPRLYWQPHLYGKVSQLISNRCEPVPTAHVPKLGEEYYELRDSQFMPITRKHGHVYIYWPKDEILRKGIRTVLEEVYEKHLDQMEKALEEYVTKNLEHLLKLLKEPIIQKHSDACRILEKFASGAMEYWISAVRKIVELRHKGMSFKLRAFRNEMTPEIRRRLIKRNEKELQLRTEKSPLWRQQLERLEAEMSSNEKILDFNTLEKIESLKKKIAMAEREHQVGELTLKIFEEMLLNEKKLA